MKKRCSCCGKIVETKEVVLSSHAILYVRKLGHLVSNFKMVFLIVFFLSLVSAGWGLDSSTSSRFTTVNVNNNNVTVGNDTFSTNYSDFLVVKDYSLNASRWSLNYSSFLTKIGWDIAYNGTLFKTDSTNVVGNFNQSFNGTTFTIWSLLNRIGIGTSVPNSTLHVVGDGNFTGQLYSMGNKNLSLASDYVTNGSLAVVSKINTWSANQTIGTQYFTNGTGGAYIRHNGTGWVIVG